MTVIKSDTDYSDEPPSYSWQPVRAYTVSSESHPVPVKSNTAPASFTAVFAVAQSQQTCGRRGKCGKQERWNGKKHGMVVCDT